MPGNYYYRKWIKIWSLTLTGKENLDPDGKEADFYQLVIKYNWLETKKEKMGFLIEIEPVIPIPGKKC